MDHQLKQVALTSTSSGNLSRQVLLKWVNEMVDGQYNNVEEMCSGVAYCKLMNLLIPNCIPLTKVKVGAKYEYDYLHNLKLVQGVFCRFNFDKHVPAELLAKGNYADNIIFLQWFKKFFEANQAEIQNTTDVDDALLDLQKEPELTNVVGSPFPSFDDPCTSKQINIEDTPTNQKAEAALQKIKYLTADIKDVEKARDFYFNKAMAVETVLQDALEKNENVEWVKAALGYLYDEGELQDVKEEP